MKSRLTKRQLEENWARANRERQQERLLRKYRYTEALKTVDKQTSDAIMIINKTIQQYPLTQAQYTTLIQLKSQAKNRLNRKLNIEIFKTCKTIRRLHLKTNKG